MELLGNNVFDELNEEQINACKNLKCAVLQACPGSGKTRVVVNRLMYFNELFNNSKKYEIAITYTNKASYEIQSRLKEKGYLSKKNWIGTIHQFCLEFIIKPYYIYNDKLKYGYRIIDEMIANAYKESIKNEVKAKTVFCNEVNIKYESIKRKNKEIDFDDILVISLELLNISNIANNISKTINSITVDEYQDTKEIQYIILSKLFHKNKEIILMFAGDINQNIYKNMGGVAFSIDKLSELFGKQFIMLSLSGCYRSTQKIINYYKSYEIEKHDISSKYYRKNISKILYEKNINYNSLVDYIVTILDKEILSGVKFNEICILAPQWYMLYSISKELKERCKNYIFDGCEITAFKYNPFSVFSLLANLIINDYYSLRRKKEFIRRIVTILENEYSIKLSKELDFYAIMKQINLSKIEMYNENIVKYVDNAICNIFENIGVDLDYNKVLNEKMKEFIKNTNIRIKRYGLPIDTKLTQKLSRDNEGILISTAHGIKGLEFKVVIAFGLLKGYIPNNNDIKNYEIEEVVRISKRLLYVICSRAKERLYLISEQGRKYDIPTEELNVNYIYDKLS